jgi:hypothetical protein
MYYHRTIPERSKTLLIYQKAGREKKRVIDISQKKERARFFRGYLQIVSGVRAKNDTDKSSLGKTGERTDTYV